MDSSLDLKARTAPSSGPTRQRVTDVRHWTDSLFSFRITRPREFRFRSGEFVMIGLEAGGRPLLRAYSIASPNWADELEFFSIKVPDGALTSRLQQIGPGDEIILGRKPVGTLVLDALTPGKILYLLSSGTGVAPFLSIVRDPETYEKFEKVVVTHTCREAAELEFGRQTVEQVLRDEFLAEIAGRRLHHFCSVTRQPNAGRQGRITSLIASGELFAAVGEAPFDPAVDRVMICGSMDMIRDTKDLVAAAGLTEGSSAAPAEFVVEKAFVG